MIAFISSSVSFLSCELSRLLYVFLSCLPGSFNEAFNLSSIFFLASSASLAGVVTPYKIFNVSVSSSPRLSILLSEANILIFSQASNILSIIVVPGFLINKVPIISTNCTIASQRTLTVKITPAKAAPRDCTVPIRSFKVSLNSSEFHEDANISLESIFNFSVSLSGVFSTSLKLLSKLPKPFSPIS
ncbi:MAG: hypothetical protein BWX61_01211 [Bacteroidetes bacterium ADurb.Bin035]|nr:MAG: hypothetical protein BWX61_01211 [Bacteroidetes bacterium ADurb.Bin035]